MPDTPTIQLDHLERILRDPLFMNDTWEAGKILSFLIKYSTRISTLSQDRRFFAELPIVEHLTQHWMSLVNNVSLSIASWRFILREDVQFITRDMWDIAKHFDATTTAGDRIDSDLLSYRVAEHILEVAWQVFEIEQSTDPRINEIRDALEGVAAFVVDVSLTSIGGTVELLELPYPTVPAGSAREEVVDTYLVPEGTEMTCNICMDQMVTGVSLEACGHCFCEECILTWINNGVGGTTACPMCRTTIAMRAAA